MDGRICSGERDCSRWKVETYSLLREGKEAKCGHCRMDSVVEVCMESSTAF